jgi:hypothetical protein
MRRAEPCLILIRRGIRLAQAILQPRWNDRTGFPYSTSTDVTSVRCSGRLLSPDPGQTIIQPMLQKPRIKFPISVDVENIVPAIGKHAESDVRTGRAGGRAPDAEAEAMECHGPYSATEHQAWTCSERLSVGRRSIVLPAFRCARRSS